MKIIAAIFAALILLIGCTRGQKIFVPTATPLTVATEVPVFVTEAPAQPPTTSPRVAYPARMQTEEAELPLATGYPHPSQNEAPYIPQPTPTDLPPFDDPQWAWIRAGTLTFRRK